jgi:hypothetical protein
MLLLAAPTEMGDMRSIGAAISPFRSWKRRHVMRDEYHARLRRENHEDSSAGIDRLLGKIMQAFRVLHRIEWSAPWATPAARSTCER